MQQVFPQSSLNSTIMSFWNNIWGNEISMELVSIEFWPMFNSKMTFQVTWLAWFDLHEPIIKFSARFDYWRNVDSMRRGGNSKIQAPVLALVGEADPDRRNILHSLMECSTSLTTMEMKGTTLMHATSPKKISYQINNFIRTNLFVPTVRFRMNA